MTSDTSLDVALRVDQVCREFERAWRSGHPITVEECLARLPPTERDELRRELEPLAEELRQSEYATTLSWPAVPGYRVLGELGRGGMGVVYRAEEVALGRQVALKVLSRHGALDLRHKQRFEREARAAAGLHHTNIIPVFGFGEHQGLCFYAMQYIRGQNLSAIIEEQRNAQSARRDETLRAEAWRNVARIGVQAASALDYAHRQGIVHRDIKPGNLILDAHGTVWIADFGLAKVLDENDLTQSGDLLGTLRYMPPEAFELTYGAAGDIYALGLTLYELLALRPAYAESDRTRLIKQKTNGDTVPLHRLDPSIPRDLATIVAKASEHDPGRRYATAGEFAADLQCFLDDAPIQARRQSSAERLGRWVMRNRAVAALSATALLALTAGTTVSILFAVLAGKRADREQASALAAIQAKQQSDSQAAQLRFKEALRRAESGAVDIGLFEMVEALRLAPRTDESQAFRRAVLLNLAAWQSQVAPLRYVLRLSDAAESGTTIRPLGRDAAAFAVLAQGRPLQFRDTGTGTLQREGWTLPLEESPLVIDGDGSQLLSRVELDGKCSLRLRNLAGGAVVGRECPVPKLEPRPALPHVFSSILSPRCVMSGGVFTAPWWGPRRFWDLENGMQYPLQLPCPQFSNFWLGQDYKGNPIVATVSMAEGPNKSGNSDSKRSAPFTAAELRFWDVEKGTPLAYPVRLRFGSDPRVGVDGRTFLTTDRDNLSDLGDGSVRWWDTHSGLLVDRWQARRQASSTILLPAGQNLAAHGHDDRIRFYDVDTGWQRGGNVHVPLMVRIWDRGGGFFPSEPVLLTFLADGWLRAWDVSRLTWQDTMAASPRSRPGPPGISQTPFGAATVSPSGQTVLLSGFSHSDYGRLVDTNTGSPLGRPLRQRYLAIVAFSPDEKTVATAPDDYQTGATPPEVHIRDISTGQLRFPPVRMSQHIHALAFSPDGRSLAVGCLGGTKLIDACTGKELQTLPEKSCVTDLAFSADGTVLAVRYRQGWDGDGAGVRLWNPATAEPLGAFLPFSWEQPLNGIDFIERGATVLILDVWRRRLVLLDAATGLARESIGLTGNPRGLVVHSESGRAAVTYTGGAVQQWDVRSGTVVGALMHLPAPITAMEYSRDGSILAVVCKERMVSLWDSATGLPLGSPLLHVGEVLAAHFSADGRELITASTAGEVRRWPLSRPPGDDPEKLELWLHVLTGRRPAGGETLLIEPEAWQECCRRLQTEWPEAAQGLAWLREAPVPAATAAWHERRAAEAEAAGNLFARLWHLEQLARLRPNDWQVHAHRGAALSRAGNNRAAEAAYAEAARRGGGAALTDYRRHADVR